MAVKALSWLSNVFQVVRKPLQRKRRSVRLAVEALEDRFCPSLTVQSVGANLLLSGSPTSSLQITGAGGLSYHLMDGSKNLGTYSFSNLTMNLTLYPAPITINLMGQTLTGNVVMSVGTGNVSGSMGVPSITVEDGRVGGSITMTGGRGNEFLDLGQSTGTNPLTVGGNLTVVGQNGTGGILRGAH